MKKHWSEVFCLYNCFMKPLAVKGNPMTFRIISHLELWDWLSLFFVLSSLYYKVFYADDTTLYSKCDHFCVYLVFQLGDIERQGGGRGLRVRKNMKKGYAHMGEVANRRGRVQTFSTQYIWSVAATRHWTGAGSGSLISMLD